MLLNFIYLPLIIALDFLLGEPKRWHPLVGFGYLCNQVEKYLLKPVSNRQLFIRGVLAWFVLVVPFVLIAYWLSNYLGDWLGIVFAYLAIGAKSLRDHALQVADALRQGDLNLARQRVGYIVSRDTSTLNEQEISRSTIESVLENGSDAIFAALFWFLVAGSSGVVLYRLSNTLDAMWGYRNQQYEYFGKFSARMDDILNWIPARLTALSYLLVGHSGKAWQSWKTQAKQWYSLNAGVVMATGAGALDRQLGGAAYYHGELKQRPLLGSDKPVETADIYHSWQLVFRAILLWILITSLVAIPRL